MIRVLYKNEIGKFDKNNKFKAVQNVVKYTAAYGLYVMTDDDVDFAYIENVKLRLKPGGGADLLQVLTEGPSFVDLRPYQTL